MGSKEAEIMKDSDHEEILPFFLQESHQCPGGETTLARLPERILSHKPYTKYTEAVIKLTIIWLAYNFLI